MFKIVGLLSQGKASLKLGWHIGYLVRCWDTTKELKLGLTCLFYCAENIPVLLPLPLCFPVLEHLPTLPSLVLTSGTRFIPLQTSWGSILQQRNESAKQPLYPHHLLQRVQLFYCLRSTPGDHSPHSPSAKLTLLHPQALCLLKQSNEPPLHWATSIYHTSWESST